VFVTITCPRCGLAFESQATTATRCPSCRTVVHISRGTSSVRSGSSQRPSRAERPYSDSDADDGGGTVVILALVAFGGWLLWQWWRSRRSQPDETGQSMEPATGPYTFATSAPTSGPAAPDAGPGPYFATAAGDATRARTGSSGDKSGRLE
jgi:LSD1 subclass zinc finger protein